MSRIRGWWMCAVIALGFAAPAHAAVDPGALPLSFVANAGQTDERARFVAQGGGYGFFFTDRGVTLTLTRRDEAEPPLAWLARSSPLPALPSGPDAVALELCFAGGKRHPQIDATGRMPATVSYLREGVTGLATYRTLTYRDVWPGIDVSFSGEHGALDYAFHVAPGADPGAIALDYRGADGLSVTPDGKLAIATGAGTLTTTKPGGSAFKLDRDGLGFELPGDHDRSQALVIEPGLAYATFLGSGLYDDVQAVAIDAQGSAYVTGTTYAAFPTTVGTFNTNNTGSGDAFVTKLNPAGTALVYSTFLGGTGTDEGSGIAVDGQGNAYVVGQAAPATGFPVSVNAYDRTPSPVSDGFVAKLNASGTALLYSTLLGGGGGENADAIALDAQGHAYVAGGTESADFPTTPGGFNTGYGGGFDAFVTKLSPTGSTLVYSTLLGGAGYDTVTGIAVDADGSALVSGHSFSATFPTTAGAYDSTPNGSDDGFVTKLVPSGTALAYSTMLGGPFADYAFDGGMPVSKLTPDGSGLEHSMIFRDAGGAALATDDQGNVFVTGSATSAFATTAGAYDPSFNGVYDGFVMKVDLRAPETTIASGMSGPTNRVTQAFSFESEAGARFECRLDSPTGAGAFAPAACHRAMRRRPTARTRSRCERSTPRATSTSRPPAARSPSTRSRRTCRSPAA